MSMKNDLVFRVALGCLMMFSASDSWGDRVLLQDGSELVGTVQQLAEGKLVIETQFAGEMTLDAGLVRGIITDEPRAVQLKSGARAIGPLNYSDANGQRVSGQDLGSVPMDLGQVTGIWGAEEDGPRIRALKKEIEDTKPKWFGSIELGLDGQTGNKENLFINGRTELHRETKTDRLMIYAQGRSSRSDGEQTAKEVLGGLDLEVDLDDRWFAFGRLELEFDEFEDLDLRTTVTGGFGFFAIREPGQELKLRGGLGFQHESFNDGTSDDQVIGELGVDFLQKITPWLLFTHHTTYYPTLEDLGDFRLVVENAAEIPLVPEEDWRVRIGIRNNYNAMPSESVKRLDTYYFVNLVLGWQ